MARALSGPRSDRPQVLKAGGGALDAPDAVVARVRAALDTGPVVLVASARRGVTDALVRSSEARATARTRRATLATLAERHAGGGADLEAVLDAARRRWGASDAPARLAPREARAWLALGERLAVRWLAAALRRAGIEAEPEDADALGLRVLGPSRAGSIDLARSRAPVAGALGRRMAEGVVPVVTGFFGGDAGGGVALLGRGGSDYSATGIGYLLGAARVTLLKPDGPLRTADPHWVPTAGVVPRLSYAEAEALGRFGAKALHPAAVGPARRGGLRIVLEGIRGEPTETEIGPFALPHGPRAITSGPTGPARGRARAARSWVAVVGRWNFRTARPASGGFEGRSPRAVLGGSVIAWQVPSDQVRRDVVALHEEFFGPPAAPLRRTPRRRELKRPSGSNFGAPP